MFDHTLDGVLLQVLCQENVIVIEGLIFSRRTLKPGINNY